MHMIFGDRNSIDPVTEGFGVLSERFFDEHILTIQVSFGLQHEMHWLFASDRPRELSAAARVTSAEFCGRNFEKRLLHLLSLSRVLKTPILRMTHWRAEI